jgi:nitroreductase
MDALKAILGRRSVRRFSDRPVEKEHLVTLVRAAMSAPSAMDTRPWAFVIVTDRDKLKSLAAGLPYASMAAQAAAAVVVCGVLSRCRPESPADYWVQDCSAATENLLVAAEALGLGAVWTGVHPRPERVEAVRRVLGLPEDVVPLNLIPLGHPGDEAVPKDKFDGNAVHWDGWAGSTGV